MTAVAFSSPRSRANSLGIAVAASTALHLALLWMPAGERRHSDLPGPYIALSVTLTAAVPEQGLAQTPAATPHEPELALVAPAARASSERRSRHGHAPAAAAPAAAPREPAGVVRPAPDTAIYSAAELDTFPRPLVMPDLSAALTRVTAPRQALRVEILVDERGTVGDVVFQEPQNLDAIEPGARAALLGALFAPALKDGRAVKSRIVLSLEPRD